MASEKFALEIIQSALSGLGYSSTAKCLIEEIEERQSSISDIPSDLVPSELLFKSWLGTELLQGIPYKLAIERLESIARDDDEALSQENLNEEEQEEVPSKFEATVILYLVKRILFLLSVIGLSYAPISPSLPPFTSQSVPIGSLLTFLKSELLPLLDKIQATFEVENSSFLPHLLMKALTRERETSILMPLVMNSPIHPVKLALTVFRLNTLLVALLTPRRDDIIVSPTYLSDIGLLNEVLVMKYLDTYLLANSRAARTTMPSSTSLPSSSASTFNIPPDYLDQLVTQASLFQKIVSPYYLPSRTSPEIPATLIPPFSINQTLKESFPSSLVFTINAHMSEIWFVKFSPLGRYLVTGSRDGKMIIYDVRSPKFLILASFRSDEQTDSHSFVGSYRPSRRRDPLEQSGVIYCSWDETESYIVSCGLDTMVRVWDVSAIKDSTAAPKRITRSMDLGEEPSGIELISCFTLGENIRVRSCQFIPRQVNSTRWPLQFIVGSPDKALKMFDIFGNEHFDFFCDTTDADDRTDEMKVEEDEEGRRQRNEEEQNAALKKSSTPSRGSASGSTSATAAASVSPPLVTLGTPAPTNNPGPMSPVGGAGARARTGGTVTPGIIIDPSTTTSKFLQSSFNRVIDFEITPNKKVMITANNDKLIQFFTVPDLTKEVLKSVKVASINLKGKPSSISVSANGKYFLVNVSQELQLWDISEILTTFKPILIRKFIGHSVEEDVVRAGFGYLNIYGGVGGEGFIGEELVLSGSADGYIYIWKLASGQLIKRIKGHEGVCSAVDWNRFYTPAPSGKDYGQLWCSIGDDNLAKIWGPPDWKQTGNLQD